MQASRGKAFLAHIWITNNHIVCAPSEKNLSALLGLKLDMPIREATVPHSCGGIFAICKAEWVFIDARSGANSKEPDWFKEERGYTPHNLPGQLFDLDADRGERTNPHAEHPAVAAELKGLLEKYKREKRSEPKL